MKGLDRMVDVLAFGRERPKPAASLGLYLSPEAAYIAETRSGPGGRLVVDHLLRVPLPKDPQKAGSTATMSADVLADQARISDALRQALSRARWSTKNVRVTLSHQLGLLRYFPIPAIDHRFLRSAVPLEARKRIPLPFESLSYDFRTVPLPPDASGKQRLGALIAVAPRKVAADVAGLVQGMGLKLVGLEVAPLSVLRLFQVLDPAKQDVSYVHVHVDGGNVRVMAVDRGVPSLFREIFLPQDATPADMRKIDMKGFLAFVQKQLELASPTALRLSGNSVDPEGLKDAFAAETGLPASVQDVPKLLSVKSGDWGCYAAIGASACALFPDEEAIDLSATDRVSDEEHRAARNILIMGAAAASSLILAGAFRSASYHYRAKELVEYERKIDPEIKASLAGLDPASVDGVLRDMQTQLDQLKGVGSGAGKTRLSEVLAQIIAAMPENLWLDRVSVSNALMDADKRPLQILLYGRVKDDSSAAEQALAFHFKDAVLNGRMGKSFEGKFSFQAAVAGEDGTQFTLELDAKRQ